MTSTSAFDPVDRAWMEQALALGALGEGATSPNPRVGCLLVRDGRLVGSGFHRAHGSPHAEAMAVARAGDRARGATAYVTLEPCAHHGFTPPCADLLVAKGVRRVVAPLRDPNPLVLGQGFDRLRAAGVQVDVGLLAAAAYRLNEPFLHRHHCGRPLVTLKAAISLDGLTSALEGGSRWISGEPARRFAHRLRLRHDAVLVGAGTVRQDDPRLTVRLPGVRADRLRVVLAPGLNLDPEAAIFGQREADGPLPRVYTGTSTGEEGDARFANRAAIVRVGERAGRLALDEVLRDLAGLQVQSLLVEGGARTFGTFLDAGLADRAALFVSKRLLGARGATPLLDMPSVREPGRGWRLAQVRQVALGEDELRLGRLLAPVEDG
jgi:diaminohydroxyphosphoribosylaminopyrimidine deaminase/5-amino-6-(5-phosphoribosylamino)uracil reductase